ncbi:YcnI family protein [Arthrobacter sp. C9C5]|uniref:YcnI family copper-binding membrane protein n=1 Tax=Arthrobacter sp. C9C5 TaxID=2735267 RepID=UPI001584AEC3|nr:YcnI family protein [Arthrobacter sp. C9C5]NUU30282.1 YcnI family protein [Arthrobacter sp. C9C5]
MLAGISGASAHVGVSPDKTTANSYALLTFAIPHGCEESATTKVAITLPPELDDAQPTVNPNWTAAKVTEKLTAPKKLADGSSITKRTSQIVYTAKTPLSPELRDALVLSVKLPDAAGKTLYFPTLQSCEVGRVDWSQVPAEGQDAHALKSPAPSLTVTAAAAATEADGHDAHGAEPAGSVTAAHASATNDDGGQARSWAGLVAGVGGLVLGGLALLRSRKPAPAK